MAELLVFPYNFTNARENDSNRQQRTRQRVHSNIWHKTLTERTTWKNLSVDGRGILKWISIN